MIYAEILAGGKGTRMGNLSLPKQFLNIGDDPIIVHTISKFLLQPKFEKIIIVVLPEWMQYAKDLLGKHFAEKELSRIKLVNGGKDRNETLMNGIDFIQNEYGINDDDIIVTHDAVRPFVSGKIIEDNISNAIKYGAVDTVIPATDTIVKGENELISDIPDRSLMYQGQTPQSFNINKLKNAYSELDSDQKKILTDAAKIMLLTGTKVKLVQGEQLNFKITRNFDLKMAQLLIEERR
ncbi:2-C-methyl-D-erythritol 4-phosphate cytidylyltransferase [Pediococcus pentosaceus]|uniref:IspD/TarI family cytidylyltransferase n=1 Tax=Pediococcus pentosaceus TaxID=1255 RepID=UPI0039ECC17E